MFYHSLPSFLSFQYLLLLANLLQNLIYSDFTSNYFYEGGYLWLLTWLWVGIGTVIECGINN